MDSRFHGNDGYRSFTIPIESQRCFELSAVSAVRFHLSVFFSVTSESLWSLLLFFLK
jgi:hypothetical protein